MRSRDAFIAIVGAIAASLALAYAYVYANRRAVGARLHARDRGVRRRVLPPVPRLRVPRIGRGRLPAVQRDAARRVRALRAGRRLRSIPHLSAADCADRCRGNGGYASAGRSLEGPVERMGICPSAPGDRCRGAGAGCRRHRAAGAEQRRRRAVVRPGDAGRGVRDQRGVSRDSPAGGDGGVAAAVSAHRGRCGGELAGDRGAGNACLQPPVGAVRLRSRVVRGGQRHLPADRARDVHDLQGGALRRAHAAAAHDQARRIAEPHARLLRRPAWRRHRLRHRPGPRLQQRFVLDADVAHRHGERRGNHRPRAVHDLAQRRQGPRGGLQFLGSDVRQRQQHLLRNAENRWQNVSGPR